VPEIPPNLPKLPGETTEQWLDRCYEAAGFKPCPPLPERQEQKDAETPPR
jgi:hypothetical protein